ncbi:MAG: hypothetical protein AB9869_11570 [Verrucomicrobiia bacterium]
MRARWRFRLVLRGEAADYLKNDGKPREHTGTAEDALELARRLAMDHGDCRVEVVSVGRPTDIADTPGRLMVQVVERADRRGWMLLGDMMSGTWHRSIKDAVSYGALRTRGYLSEARIVNGKGQVTHVILIDTRSCSDGKLFSPTVGPKN